MKTKLLLLFFVYSFLPAICIAQHIAETPPASNNEKKWRISLQLNTIDKMAPLATMNTGIETRYLNDGVRYNKSYALGIMGNYFLSDNISARLKAGITKNYITELSEYSLLQGTYSIDDVEIKEKSVNFVPGISFHSINQQFKMFELFCGFEIPVIFHDTLYVNNNSVIKYTIDNSIYWHGKSKIKAPGGYSLGAGVFFGFNIFFKRNFILGGEFASAFLYSKIGGKTVQQIETVDYASNYENTVISYNDNIESFFLTSQKLSIRISYVF